MHHQSNNIFVMKRLILLFAIILSETVFIAAQTSQHPIHLPDCFDGRALRVDYIFSGNAHHQQISLHRLHVLPHWHGRKINLDRLPVEGNAQIEMRDHQSGKLIYTTSFSTLFQEWMTYEEAQHTTRAFENVILLPMPRDTADVTVIMRNNRREIAIKFTHRIIPTDILIRKTGYTSLPYETIQSARDTNLCVNIAFIAEGYQENEMDKFISDARNATEAILSHEPFKSRKEDLNIIAVKSPSQDSGTTIPHKNIWKNTALGSQFDTFYSERYLTTLNLFRLHDLLAGTPYDHIIVLVNTEQYGGGGILNFYNLVAARNPQFRPVVVHEFGHSFAGLADEYAYDNESIPMYPHDVEPWEYNITTLADFHGKWENLITPKTPLPTPENYQNTIGLYEGAGYSVKGVYRAFKDCRMRTNSHPEFCPVCQEAIDRIIRFHLQP